MITKLRQYIYVRVCQNSVVTWETVTYDITVTTLLCMVALRQFLASLNDS